jgi:predicted dehydrogenase
MAARYAIPLVADDFRALLDRVDAVVVCTPTDSHAGIGRWFLSHGAHVLCEKPLGRSLEEVDSILEAVQEAGLSLTVALVRRYDPEWLAVAKEVLAGSIGRPTVWRSLDASFGPIDKPWYNDERVGGGPLLDEAVHIVDFAVMLFGSVDWVYATGLTLRSSNSAADTGLAVIHFAGGDCLQFGTSWGLPRNCRGSSLFDLIGPLGTITRSEREPALPLLVVSTERSRWPIHCDTSPLERAFRGLAKVFVDSVTGVCSEPQDLLQIREAHRVTFGLLESIYSGNPVRLD